MAPLPNDPRTLIRRERLPEAGPFTYAMMGILAFLAGAVLGVLFFLWLGYGGRRGRRGVYSDVVPTPPSLQEQYLVMAGCACCPTTVLT